MKISITTLLSTLLLLNVNLFFAQINSGGEYNISSMKKDLFLGARSKEKYKLRAGFSYTYSKEAIVFIFEEQSPNIYKIKSKETGNYLYADIAGDKSVRMNESPSGASTLFKLKKIEDRVYTIQVADQDWHWRFKKDEIELVNNKWKAAEFLITKYENPETQTKDKFKHKIKLRNIATKEYVAFDRHKGWPGPIKMGGYFEEESSFELIYHGNNQVSFYLGGSAIFAKATKEDWIILKGNGYVGAPQCNWIVEQAENGVYIKHAVSGNYLATGAENQLALTTRSSDPRALWQFDKGHVRLETIPSGDLDVYFTTFLKGGEYFAFGTYDFTDKLVATKTLNGEYSHWKMIKTGTAQFKFYNVGKQKYLSMVSKGNGYVVQLTDDMGDNSLWTMKKRSIGGFEVKNKAIGKTMITYRDGNTSVDGGGSQWVCPFRENITNSVITFLESR